MKCLRCGADAPPNLTSSLCPECLATNRKNQFPIVLVLIGGFLALVIFLVALSPHSEPSAPASEIQTPSAPETQSSPATPAATAAPTSNDAAPAKPTSNWDYSTVEMNAGTKTERVGCITSDNTIDLHWPYKSVPTSLCFRSDATVYFQLLGDGQMLNGEEHGARIRLGNGPARRFSLERSGDYSSNGAFVVPAGPVFAAARSGKTIIIDATYYEAGSQSAGFTPTEPLKLK